MNKGLLLTLVVFGAVVWGEITACISCGMECESACGTRHFRTCCFNYLRKRNQAPPIRSNSAMDPSVRLELWLAQGRGSVRQRDFETPSSPIKNAYRQEEEP